MGRMAVVIASDRGKDVAGEPLLRGISFKLERRDRMALSGRNGAGKTTLLRMLAGEASVDSGERVLAKDVKVALHDQRPPRHRDITLRDYVLSGARELVAIEAELASLEQAMAAGAHDDATMGRYAAAQARLEHAGGYDWRQRALATLGRLGFREGELLDRRLDTFSGGELTRASLGRALAGAPDLLLLDEPTNHLDIESLEWLEQHLASLDAAIVLVAHDRWFLEAVGTSVLELEAGRGRFFKGPWSAWRKEKAARELALGRAIERQQAEIERLERFVTRFRAGTRARQAQSRAKKLAKMERIGRGPADGAGLEFAFKPPERSGRFLCSGEEAEKPLEVLSGGERRRLSLAILVQSGANVLILDEPTNHLDLESREALEQALNQFAGSLLLVSHDRALLDAVSTRTVAFEDATRHSYVGGWPEHVRVREERGREQAQAKAAKLAVARRTKSPGSAL